MGEYSIYTTAQYLQDLKWNLIAAQRSCAESFMKNNAEYEDDVDWLHSARLELEEAIKNFGP